MHDNQLAAQYQAASQSERLLWSEVTGKHPGEAGHDGVQWRKWLEAATEVQRLARLMRTRQ